MTDVSALGRSSTICSPSGKVSFGDERRSFTVRVSSPVLPIRISMSPDLPVRVKVNGSGGTIAPVSSSASAIISATSVST